MKRYNECHRCNKETSALIGSMFNTQMICLECKEKETKHPRYEEAVKREYEEVLKGNYNYEGLAIEEGFEI